MAVPFTSTSSARSGTRRAAAAAAATRPPSTNPNMKLSKTDYRGGGALVLSTPALELVVTTSVGPRVVSLRSQAGRAGNLLFQLPDSEQRYHGYYLRGGHRL